jgi:predicted permease
MTEGLAIALMGAVMGALIAYWAQGLLAAWVAGGQSAPAASSTPDLRMLAFCVALSLASGVLLSAAPALSGSRAGSFTVRGATRGPSGRRPTLRGALTVAQVSLSFALLTVAGLLIGTLRNLEREDLGFDPEGLLLFRMDPRLSGYPGPAMFELYETLAERLEALPGVRSATLSRHPLLAGSSERTGDGLFVHAPGQEVQEGVAHLHRVRWNFFETMEMPLLSGRAFTASDDRGASLVAIVNEAFAATYYPGRSPVGGRFSFGHPEADAFEIVGVVGDAKYTGQRDAVPPTVYVHYIQAGPTQVNFAVRADGDPTLLIPGVRAAIREVAPDLPIFETRTQSALAEARLSAERRLAWTSSLVGLAALLLTCVALYGTVSSRVSRRTPEIGVRIALGASRRSVLGLVLAETAALVVTGIFAGALLAQASTRLLVEQLFHVSPNAADVRLSAALVMLCVGVLAAYVPAIRAARVDPMVALRND